MPLPRPLTPPPSKSLPISDDSVSSTSNSNSRPLFGTSSTGWSEKKLYSFRKSSKDEEIGVADLPLATLEKEPREQRRTFKEKERERERRFGPAGEEDIPLPNLTMSSGGSRKKNKKLRFQSTVKVYWDQLKRNLTNPVIGPPSSESTNDASRDSIAFPSPLFSSRKNPSGRSGAGGEEGGEMTEEEEDGPVEQIVVDNVLYGEGADGTAGSSSQSSADGSQTGNADGLHLKNNGRIFGSTSNVATTGGDSSTYFRNLKSTWDTSAAKTLTTMIYRVVRHFFDLKFHDPSAEKHFQKEHWISTKMLCFMTSLFYILSWVLIISLGYKPWSTYNKVCYFGLMPALTVPLPFLVFFDVPVKHHPVWQLYAGAATWFFACVNVIDIRLCHFYEPSLYSCGQKDFLGTFYFATAFPAFALFTLNQSRLSVLIGGTIWTALASSLVIPERTGWVRLMISEVVYFIFLVFAHFLHETAEREIFSVREHLKVQMKAVQRSQVAEGKANDSKRRYVSYIFHEVRVPLNAASLTASELQESWKDPALFQDDLRTLVSSLETMRTILDDVLDLNKMDAGKFVLVKKPFDWRHLMTSIISAEQRATKAKDQTFKVNLDPEIDDFAIASVKSALKEYSESEEDSILPKTGALKPIVIGDEQRIRQIVSNLFSNAIKFTQRRGTITFTTKLLHPIRKQGMVNGTEGSGGKKKMVVRIEVSDTGCGIKKSDLTINHLFSPFTQTEKGLEQGGKGTGLGLSLVRQLVKVSNGRLGVMSKFGEGSTFWVELVLGVGEFDTAAGEFIDGNNFLHNFGNLHYSKSTISMDRSLSPLVFTIPRDTSSTMSSTSTQVDKQLGLSEMLDDRRPEKMQKIAEVSPVPSVKAASPPRSSPSPSSSPQNTPTLAHLQTPSQLLNSSGSPKKQRRLLLEDNDIPLDAFVVDDDNITRKLMCRVLHKSHVRVEEAENGQIALDRLLGESAPGYLGPPVTKCSSPTTSPIFEDDGSSVPAGQPRTFDVVFLDFHMPIKTGAAVVSELRQRGRHDLVVGVTANGLKEEQDAYMAAGCDRVLTKPVNPALLRGMLAIARERKVRAMVTASSTPTPPPLPTPPALPLPPAIAKPPAPP
ncbi:hypothetical protein BT69DRAFT_930299 [Atractiella rhizophila]|nr:hypothetical protein BT69DRAFT_930299 [Atractiella rhizophila]